MNEDGIVNFPKIKSPFVRKRIEGRYVVTPEITEGYEWVFEDNGVKAVDKLHGTNLCIIIKDRIVMSVDNRSTRVLGAPTISMELRANEVRMLSGILKAREKGYIKEDGRIYGELIGPTLNGNIHGVHDHIFVPFNYLASKCHWKTWISNKYPKTFDSISAWFRDLPSLYSERHHMDALAEGIVFLHPDGRMAKLRRDMFPWHEENE